MRKKILFIFGTRPEAIKLFPLINKLKSSFNVKICSTTQHREMLDQVFDLLNILPDFNLNIMKKNQDLFYITTKAINDLKNILLKIKPNLVIVQGDTTSAFAGALASFYLKIPVAHVEAGLRTNKKYSPFPEEVNRQLISRISKFNFCPTKLSKANLIKEGIKHNTYITGNTVIDSIKILHNKIDKYKFKNKILSDSYNKLYNCFDKKVIMITIHRRENVSSNLYDIFSSVKKLSNVYHDCLFIFPIHKNPFLRNKVKKIVNKVKNIKLIEPLDYLENLKLINKSYFIISDSGGIQEEAPYFGTPLLLARNDTERPEGINSRNSIMVGSSFEKIHYFSKKLLNNKKFYKIYSKVRYPYGDGKTSEKILKILSKNL
jgi:UDP-N-acetylglucosamine 2-epimerase (non-hydrolysing)